MIHLGEFFLNIIFPRRCVGCGKMGTYFCTRCTKRLEIIPPFCIVCKRASIDGSTHRFCKTPRMIDGVFALTYYKESMKKAIRLLKYHSVTDLVDSLTSLWLDGYPKYIPRFDILTPIPLHKKRLRMRGYNQAQLLAVSLGKKKNTLVINNVLQRIRFSKPQIELKGKERRINIIGAFDYNPNILIAGKCIGIVDDVTTTGATIVECGKVLKANGAREVWGIVLAHGN